LGDDGEARQITGITGSVITFSPAASDIVREGEVVFLWDASDDVKEDFSLVTGSPCIDAGNPEPMYNDLDGSRNDIGLTGGPLALE